MLRTVPSVIGATAARILYPNARTLCQSDSSSFIGMQDVSKRKLKQRNLLRSRSLDDGDGVCAAYCTHTPVSLAHVAQHFKNSSFAARKGHNSVTFTSDTSQLISTDAVHVALQAPTDATTHYGHAFFFSSGAAVFWGLPLDLRRQLLDAAAVFQERHFSSPRSRLGKTRSVENAPMRMEDFDHEFTYTIDAHRKRSAFKNDCIELAGFSDPEPLLALSYGLAQSVKLLTYEEVIDSLVVRTRTLPDELAREGKIRLSQKDLKRLIGELLAARYSLNLVSDILDTPEFFWNHPQLERLHLDCSREVELRQRARILDTRTQVIKDALDVLNNELTSSSSDRVERAILFLIAVEVFLEVVRIVPMAT